MGRSVTVSERNELIHHFLPRWQPDSLELMTSAESYLDQHEPRIIVRNRGEIAVTAKINETRVKEFWAEHNLEGKIDFLSLSINKDRRSKIKVKYLCCPNLEPIEPDWNNFRRKIEEGQTSCYTCLKSKSEEDWKLEFGEAISSHPGLFEKWDVVTNAIGEIYFTSVCRVCKKQSRRLANHQTITGVREGSPLCRKCASVARGEALSLTPEC